MSVNLSLMMHSLFVVAVATLGFAVVCGLIARPFLNWSNQFNPHSRLFLLRLFAAWPLLGGLAVGAMVSLPSINHASQLPFAAVRQGGCTVQQAQLFGGEAPFYRGASAGVQWYSSWRLQD